MCVLLLTLLSVSFPSLALSFSLSVPDCNQWNSWQIHQLTVSTLAHWARTPPHSHQVQTAHTYTHTHRKLSPSQQPIDYSNYPTLTYIGQKPTAQGPYLWALARIWPITKVITPTHTQDLTSPSPYWPTRWDLLYPFKHSSEPHPQSPPANQPLGKSADRWHLLLTLH